MAERSRYNISKQEGGIENGILKNKLSIKTQQELDDTETLLLSDAYEYFFHLSAKKELTFGFTLLTEIHKYFLGTLYSWAGKTRRMNISKGDVLFAPAEHLENSIKEFTPILLKNLPQKDDNKQAISQKLALIHNELNVLHPFREGNGRTIRLFLDLIANSLGYQPIDWSVTKHSKYIDACKHGMVQNHNPMGRIIYRGLRKI